MTAGADPMREQWLDWAIQTGRILAASRPTWAERWDRDPEVCRSWLSLAAPVQHVAVSNANPVRVSASTYSTVPTQTASGLDVSRLPPRLQRAAAREPDRGKVYRWIEHYGGLSDVDPTMLDLEGEGEFAAAVRADDGEARAEAAAAEAAAIEAANDAHQRQLMADADRRREESLARYGEASE